MPEEIKAIETRYKNCRFRSRTEARWAVFFTELGVTWEYEKEGFKLPSGRYLPDFWLPQVKMWAEVKGQKFTDAELEKCSELVVETGRPCLLLEGVPAAKPYDAFELLCDGDPMRVDYELSDKYLFSESRFFSSPGDGEVKDDSTRRAVGAALSARFEFGETPT